MDYIDQLRNSGNDYRFHSTEYNKHSIIDNQCNPSNIYEYFSTEYGIAFFSKRREEHYQILNYTVFRALVILDKNIDIFNVYEIQNIELIIFSTVYENAKRHLKKDNPRLIDEIEKLYEDIKKYNLETTDLNELIDKTMKDFFRKSQGVISKNYEIDHNKLKTIMLEIWNHGLNDIKKYEDIEDFEKYIKDIQNHLDKGSNNENKIYLNNHYIGKGNNTNEINKIFEIIENDILKNNVIIQKIKSIIKNKLVIEQLFREIESACAPISNDIDKKVYSTYRRCCPNVWKVIWESIRLPFG